MHQHHIASETGIHSSKIYQADLWIVSPGVYADYGFFLLQKGKMKEAKENLNKEIVLYPESKVFIDRILKMIEE